MTGTYPAGWNVTIAGSSGASVTGSQAAPTAPHQHIVESVSVSFSAAPAAAVQVQIKDGSTVIYSEDAQPVAGQALRDVFGPDGIACTPGNAATIVIAAPGGSVVAKGNLHGRTV